MSAERTAWHPPFTTLLRDRGPRWAKITGELQLSQEPARADDCIEVRVDVVRDPGDRGQVLRGLWPHVTVVALLEFKSVSRPFRRGDLARLLAYGLIWFYAHQSHDALAVAANARRRATFDDLTLALVVPTITPTLLEELEQMRALTLVRDAGGYHRVRGAFCTLIVVELAAAAADEHDEYMAWFAGARQQLSLETARWIGQNTSKVNAMDKASPQLEGYDDWLQSFLADIPPSERLAGLDPTQQILALSDNVLQMLPDSFFATLPPDVQASVRARIGRP